MAESNDPFNNVSGLEINESEIKSTNVEYPTAYSPDIQINKKIISIRK